MFSPFCSGSQFFITTVPCPWLVSPVPLGRRSHASQLYHTHATTPFPFYFLQDGKHVVFGEVVSGQDVVKAVEAEGSQSGKTKNQITITDSGEA